MSGPIKVDVIVIGAGLSGLVAAYNIIQRASSLEVLVLEAKDRIGGRLLSEQVKVSNHQQCLFDMGGQWISSQQTHLVNLIEKLELQLIPQFVNGYTLGELDTIKESYSSYPILGGWGGKRQLSAFYTKLESMADHENFRKIRDNDREVIRLDSITMESFILQNISSNPARQVARTIVQITCGLEPSQISVYNYLVICDASKGFNNQNLHRPGCLREYWLSEGAQEICSRLVQILGRKYVHVNEPVLKIIDDDNELYITVVTRENIYSCYNVIAAVPPNEVLKINFEPSLSGLRASVLQQSIKGHLTKFVVTYKRAFWRSLGYSGEVICCNNGPIKICFDATKKGHAAITGYINNFEGQNINKSDKDLGSYKEGVVKQLARYWGDEALTPIDYKEKSWIEETYVGGCPMNCAAIGTAQWYYLLQKPTGRVHWAGTETSREWNGYMEGAVQAGYRSAIEVLYNLRPQCLTYKDMDIIRSRSDNRILATFPTAKAIAVLLLSGIGAVGLYNLLTYKR